MTASRSTLKRARTRVRNTVKFLRRHRLLKPLAWTAAVLALAGSTAFGHYYVQFSRVIDARLHGERDRAVSYTHLTLPTICSV